MVKNMVHDLNHENHRAFAFAEVIRLMTSRYTNEKHLWKSLSESQRFSVSRMALLQDLLIAVWSTKSVSAKAMLTRSIIELNADLLFVLRCEDPDGLAKKYSESEYDFAMKMEETQKRLRKTGAYSKTQLRKRHFSYLPKWTKIKLTTRVEQIDKKLDAVNWYDILSHFTHNSLIRTSSEFREFENHLIYAANYYAATSILATLDADIFNIEEKDKFIIFSDGII